MVDISDPKFWAEGFRVVIAAPQIVVPLLIAFVSFTWWFRGFITQGSIDGLRERNGALEERLRLAQDSENTIARKSAELENQVAALKAKIEAGATGENLIGATGPISLTVSEIKAANTEVRKALLPGPIGPTGPTGSIGPMGTE